MCQLACLWKQPISPPPAISKYLSQWGQRQDKLHPFIVLNIFWSPSSQLRRACVCGSQNWTSRRCNFSPRPAGNLVSNHEPCVQRENWPGREADHSLPSNAATVSINALPSPCNSCWTAKELSHSFSRWMAEITAVGYPQHWQCDTPLSAKMTLTSPTSGGRSVGIVRSRTKATEVVS
jgi:hypothetical protein